MLSHERVLQFCPWNPAELGGAPPAHAAFQSIAFPIRCIESRGKMVTCMYSSPCRSKLNSWRLSTNSFCEDLSLSRVFFLGCVIVGFPIVCVRLSHLFTRNTQSRVLGVELSSSCAIKSTIAMLLCLAASLIVSAPSVTRNTIHALTIRCHGRGADTFKFTNRKRAWIGT